MFRVPSRAVEITVEVRTAYTHALFFFSRLIRSRAMPQAVSRRPVATEAWVQSQAILCGIFGGHITLEQGFLQILRFSPVTIIPPMFHTHSLTYHRRCMMLAIDSVVK